MTATAATQNTFQGHAHDSALRQPLNLLDLLLLNGNLLLRYP